MFQAIGPIDCLQFKWRELFKVDDGIIRLFQYFNRLKGQNCHGNRRVLSQ